MSVKIKVRITSCVGDWWYKDRIGETFIVDKEPSVGNPKYGPYYSTPLGCVGGIYVSSCEVVPPTHKNPIRTRNIRCL